MIFFTLLWEINLLSASHMSDLYKQGISTELLLSCIRLHLAAFLQLRVIAKDMQ